MNIDPDFVTGKSGVVIDKELAVRICNDNQEAKEWLEMLRVFVHVSDDIVDVDVPAASQTSAVERLCFIAALQLKMYTHPFFLKNMHALHGAMLSNLNAYADSVIWEKENGWRKTCSDWLRHGGIEVVMIIAAITGGYDNMRSVSQELRSLAYDLHHDKEGNVI